MGGNNEDFEEQLLSSKGQLCSTNTLLFQLSPIQLLHITISAAANVYSCTANEM